jgi:hypothetical protein
MVVPASITVVVDVTGRRCSSASLRVVLAVFIADCGV